jgi:hypothetical protein
MAIESPQLSTETVDKVVENRHMTAALASDFLVFRPIAHFLGKNG